jgi:hypothetical protein
MESAEVLQLVFSNQWNQQRSAGGFVKSMESALVVQVVLSNEWNQQRCCRWFCQTKGNSRGAAGSFAK